MRLGSPPNFDHAPSARLRETFRGLVFETVIKQAVRFRDAAEGYSMFEHHRSADFGDGYRRLPAEVLEHMEAARVAA